MKSTPAAIIDVHRDAVPPGEYQASVNGQAITKVKLVLGRSNPNNKTNMEFAKNLKAVMDKKFPGLSNGIYIGKGSYNQDLSPRAMLIEVGAHTNDKIAAENGVKLFAEILPSVLGVTPTTGANVGEAAKKPATSNQKSGTTIAILLVVVAAVAGGFFLLNKGSAGK
jgi:stage II sporulation protein P